MSKKSAAASRREALREQRIKEQARQRRQQKTLLIGAIVAVVTVLGIVILVLLQNLNKPHTSAEQQSPPNVTKGYGIQIVSKDAKPTDSAPNLVIWEDPQCPICKQREQLLGPFVKDLVDQGKITAEIRIGHFLDAQLRNDSSIRATNALAAADAAGFFREYHDALFAHQPEEGVGFTDEQLRAEFPKVAGITGEKLAKFQKLYDDRAFTDFAKKANDQFAIEKIEGTPSYIVNGRQVKFVDDQGQPIELSTDAVYKAILRAAEG